MKPFAKNKPFLIVLIIIGAGIALNVVFISAILGRRAVVSKDMSAQEVSAQMYKGKPFLGTSDLAKLQTQLKELEREYEKFKLAALPELRDEMKSISDSASFKDVLFQKEEYLAKYAARASVKFPASLGFEKYEKSVIAENEIPKLVRELDIVDGVAMLLIENGVAVESLWLPGTESVSKEEILYKVVPVQINMTCTTGGLINFMHALTEFRYRVTIERLEIASSLSMEATTTDKSKMDAAAPKTNLKANMKLVCVLPESNLTQEAQNELRQERLKFKRVFSDLTLAKKYEALLAKPKGRPKTPYYSEVIKNDIFSEARAAKPASLIGEGGVYRLLSVTKEPLPIMYKGYIELEAGKLIAQIDWKRETRFATKGEEINGFKVAKISKDFLELLDQSGKVIRLDYLVRAYEDELSATIYDSSIEKSFNVKKGSKLGEYKVLDIRDNFVILLVDNKEVTIKLED